MATAMAKNNHSNFGKAIVVLTGGLASAGQALADNTQETRYRIITTETGVVKMVNDTHLYIGVGAYGQNASGKISTTLDGNYVAGAAALYGQDVGISIRAGHAAENELTGRRIETKIGGSRVNFIGATSRIYGDGYDMRQHSAGVEVHGKIANIHASGGLTANQITDKVADTKKHFGTAHANARYQADNGFYGEMAASKNFAGDRGFSLTGEVGKQTGNTRVYAKAGRDAVHGNMAGVGISYQWGGSKQAETPKAFSNNTYRRHVEQTNPTHAPYNMQGTLNYFGAQNSNTPKTTTPNTPSVTVEMPDLSKLPTKVQSSDFRKAEIDFPLPPGWQVEFKAFDGTTDLSDGYKMQYMNGKLIIENPHAIPGADFHITLTHPNSSEKRTHKMEVLFF